jgi:YVTN family beta-propeller protein
MFANDRMAGLHALVIMMMSLSPLTGFASQNYQIWVSDEKSGDVTVIDGGSNQVLAMIPVGKRPRGIHAGPDGKKGQGRRR